MLNSILKLMAPLQRRVRNMVARGVIELITEDKALQRAKMTFLSEETLDKLEHVSHYGFQSSPLPGAEGVAVFLGGERSSGVVIATEDRRFRFKTLASGEVALYTDEGDYIHFKRNRNIEVLAGTKIKVTAPDSEVISTTKCKVTSPLVEVIASTKVILTTPLCEISGNTTIGGTLAVTGATTMSSTLNVSGATTVPALTAAAITAASLAASGAVSSGATTMAGIKSTFNSHTHPENGDGGGTTSAPNQSIS